MKLTKGLIVISLGLTLLCQVTCQESEEQVTYEPNEDDEIGDPSRGVDMFGNEIVRNRVREAEAYGRSPNSYPDEEDTAPGAAGANGAEGSYEDSDSSITAEPAYVGKPIKQELQLGPDSYDEKGLPPQIKAAKKKIKLEEKEQQEKEWFPEDHAGGIEEQ